jgi:hypothetical protein
MILYNYFNNSHIINNINIQNIENVNNSNIKNVNNLNLENININDNYNVCFIISCKYNKNYINFIKYYIDNIIKYYTNYLIIIVDNNSIYINELIELFNFLNNKNIIILINNNECKFEIGAYNYGIIYLIQNNLIDKYDYYIFTQDNFVLKNKYDFNIFKNNNIYACPINEHDEKPYFYSNITEYAYEILKKINLYDNLDKITFCWCNSFILHKSKIINYYNYVKDIIIINRFQSECSERYLPRILYELNNHKNYNIDGFMNNIKYNPNDKYININIFSYFEKKLQGKNENTIE